MYQVDPLTKDIIISGFQNGIADDPYSGISDMRNINNNSIPGEASVSFSTQRSSSLDITNASMTNSSAANDTITFSGASGLENGMAITFSAISDATKGIALNTPYWVKNLSGSTCKLSAVFEMTTTVDITADGLTGTFSAYNVATPKYFAKGTSSFFWMIDSSGQVWTNQGTTASGYWMFAGNTQTGTSVGGNGNGLVVLSGSDGKDWLFVFRNSAIDYSNITSASASQNMNWTYGWDITLGTSGHANGACNLKAGATDTVSHEAHIMPDGRTYFVDKFNVWKLFEKVGSNFDPTNTATYTQTTYPLLPLNDIANCLAPSGTNILIGGARDIIYTWDTTSSLTSYPILLAEKNVQKMVTVNTNTYAFVGNRGRIYITNGVQAQLFKKVPDHLSGVVEPYFKWGGAISIRNQLFFGVYVSLNGVAPTGNYGGIWAVDLETRAIRLAMELSYNAFTGYVSALIDSSVADAAGQILNPAGFGLIAGWDNNVGTSLSKGIDMTIATPYTSGQAYVISDGIPIGTNLKPTTSTQIEFKLSVPLQTGESIQLLTASNFLDTYTSLGTVSGDGNLVSGNLPMTVQQQQWIYVKAILTTRWPTTPSYCRLTQLRIIGGIQ